MEKNPSLVSDYLHLHQRLFRLQRVYRILHQTCHQKLLLMEILLKNPPNLTKDETGHHHLPDNESSQDTQDDDFGDFQAAG